MVYHHIEYDKSIFEPVSLEFKREIRISGLNKLWIIITSASVIITLHWCGFIMLIARRVLMQARINEFLSSYMPIHTHLLTSRKHNIVPSNWNCFSLANQCHFYPRPLLVIGYVFAGVCVCVCVRVCVSLCVNHLLVPAISRDPFIASQNLEQDAFFYFIFRGGGGQFTLT